MTTALTLAVLVLVAVVGRLSLRVRQQQRQLDSLWSLMGHRKQRSSDRWLPAVAAVLLSAASAVAVTDEAAASLDRQQFPAEQWPQIYYYSTAAVDDAVERGALDVALRLVVPSVSRQPVLERCSPVAITETCYRLHIDQLQWDYGAWTRLVSRHPYAAEKLPLVVRGDWLLLNLTDSHASPAYYELLFGGKAPKTRDEALKVLGVSSDVGLQFGMIEGQSGVSKQGVRLIRNLSILRGYAWGTNDVLELDSDQDPLEQPENDFRHDGQEWIIGLPKIHMGTGTRGALQCYFLANGQGGIVDRAPVDLVEDATQFRGLREIRNAGSCIQCHRSGLNLPTRNDLRDAIASGVEAWAGYDQQQQVEQFHFADLAKEIARNNEDFASIVKLATGVTPEQASGFYRDAILRYDEPIDLDRAAFELRRPAAEVKLALAYASEHGVKLTARLSGLAHGRTIPRAAWETSYLSVLQLCQAWESQK